MNTLSMFLLQAQPQQQGSSWSGLLMIVLIFVVFWLFFIRPQNKKQKEIAQFRRSLQVGQSVITAGGIHGIVKEINDNDVMLEIDRNVKVRVDKNSIFAAAADANANATQTK